jgi:hypothetical protein
LAVKDDPLSSRKVDEHFGGKIGPNNLESVELLAQTLDELF